jgi:SAM-dependent methyltransferase
MLKEHYQKLYLEHGDSPLAVHWADSASQSKRFEILTNIVSNQNASVLDVGCGLGHMAEYLYANGFVGKYHGVDFVHEFIENGNSKYKYNSSISFSTCDIINENLPNGYDYVLLSGVFNNKTDKNEDFLHLTISKMFSVANIGIGFNAMSTYVDFQAEDLYYSDPTKVFDFCKKKLTRKIILKHDYILRVGSIPFEYTIFLFK